MKRIILLFTLLCNMSCVIKAMQPSQKKSPDQPRRTFKLEPVDPIEYIEYTKPKTEEDQALIERIRAASERIKLKSKL